MFSDRLYELHCEAGGVKPNREKILFVFIGVLVVALLVAAWGRIQTGPPRKIVFAAGVESGAYYTLAQKYKTILAESGLEVEVLATNGSRENLELLEQGKADIAFAQSGLKGKSEDSLLSLGSMFFEPVWVFMRGETKSDELLGFKGKKIGIGSPGSGTLDLALTLLQDNRMLNEVKAEKIGGEEGTQALLAGNLDALVIVGAASLSSVKTLANTPGIELVDFERAQAYSRYHDSLTAVTLHRGMLNLAQDIPAEDVQLVASSANLIVRKDFHYALVTLVLQTAQRVHRAAGTFNDYDYFPNARMSTFPLVPEAESFYRKGPSFFYRNLPFYPAAALDRLLILLLPLITLLLPLGRLLPPLFGWFQKRRIYKKIEILSDIELNEENWSREERLKRLQLLKEDLGDVVSLPPAYQNDVFLLQLRMERLEEKLKGTTPDSVIAGRTSEPQ